MPSIVELPDEPAMDPATDVAVSLAASAISSRALRAKAKDMGEPPETDYSPQIMGVVEALKAIEIKQTILDDQLKLETLILEKKVCAILISHRNRPIRNELFLITAVR
jgi:hypothetical protein